MQEDIQKAKLTEERRGRAFQREGPVMAKDPVWAIMVLTCGTKRTFLIDPNLRLSKDFATIA